MASAEYVAVVVVVAALVTVVLGLALDTRAADAGARAVRCLFEAACESGGAASPGPPDGPQRQGDPVDPRVVALQERSAEQAPLVERHGGRVAELDAQARQGRADGNLDRAEALRDRIDHLDTLMGSSRGEYVEALQVSDAQWDQRVEQATIHRGDTNVRYFDIPPRPGEGVVVVDWWIPDSDSLGLKGDDRRYEDPLFGDLEPTDSRIVVTMDLETGRASITQSETCTVSVLGQSVCNEPRPIALDLDDEWANDAENDMTGEGINLDQTNRFEITETDGGQLAVDYDALNSITPAGSVDGGIRVDTGEGAVDTTRVGDAYPSIATTQYLPGQEPTMSQHDSQGVENVIPYVPDLCNPLDCGDEVEMAPGPLDGTVPSPPTETA